MFYKTLTYQTINGLVQVIELPDSAYSEWVIYEDNKPAYHVNLFKDDSSSDQELKSLFDSGVENIESVLNKINRQQKVSLKLSNTPLLKITKSTELIEWELKPLPINWVQKLN